jgi:hypothetical protein
VSKFTIKSLRWLAPVALVGTLGLAACGDDDATVSAETAGVGAAVGSDRHLENLAAEIAERSEASVVSGSDRHLENLAAEIAERSEQSVVSGSDRHLENLAAEIAEQSEQSEPSEASASDSEPNVWEAGNRAAAERFSNTPER